MKKLFLPVAAVLVIAAAAGFLFVGRKKKLK